MNIRKVVRLLCATVVTGNLIWYWAIHTLLTEPEPKMVTMVFAVMTIIPFTALFIEFVLMLGVVHLRYGQLPSYEQLRHAWHYYGTGMSVFRLGDDAVKKKEECVEQELAEERRRREEEQKQLLKEQQRQEEERKRLKRIYGNLIRKAQQAGVHPDAMEAIYRLLGEGEEHRVRKLIEAVRNIKPVVERAYKADKATGDRVKELIRTGDVDAVEPTIEAAERRRDLLAKARTFGVEHEIRPMIEAGDEAGANARLEAILVQSVHRSELEEFEARVEALPPEVKHAHMREHLNDLRKAIQDERAYRKARYTLRSMLNSAEESQRLRRKSRHRTA